MNVKIDTKEKFHEITLQETSLSANMTDALLTVLEPYLRHDVKNIILRLSQVTGIDMPFAEALVQLQQRFYDQGASFVICETQSSVEKFLDDAGLLEVMNLTPTLSEAWDMVQMEEIEREFFDSE